MKHYRVTRSIFGDLGPLRRDQTIAEDDPRIEKNPTAVKLLVERKLLVLESGQTETPSKPQAKPAREAKSKET